MGGGWDILAAAVVAAQAEVAAAAPDGATAIEGEAYVIRVLTACLNDAFLGHLLSHDGLGRVLPVRGAPNPDYLMQHAAIDASRRYRIEGRLNDSERVGVGLYAFGAGGAAEVSDYAVFEASTAGPDGYFALDIAADAAGAGALTIHPDARVLLVRTLHRDALGVPARLTLAGGPPPKDMTLAQGSTEAALGQVARAMLNSVRQFLEWSRVASSIANGFLSETPDMAQGVQGEPDTTYFLGSYDLPEGGWLEILMPARMTGYWSLHVYNHWCEALPGAGVHDRSAVRDPNGGVRITLGPALGATLPNRIDTLGRRRGVLVCRFLGSRGTTVPLTRLHAPGEIQETM